MGRRDSVLDQMTRNRRAAIYVAVPVALILAVVFFIPRNTRSGTPITQQGPVVEYTTDKPVDETLPDKYAVVIDAGSTGSRVHVFHFKVLATGHNELQKDTFEQLKPGLSAYPDDPQQAAESLNPLLETALNTVPKELQAETSIKVGATAGLRMLKEGAADNILEAVTNHLKTKYPFKLEGSKAVGILDGAEEGAFAWLTLNYLLGHIGKPEADTVAAIDLGGGSVQEAYALTEEEANAAPKTDYVLPLKGGGKVYNVYVYSYLKFGLMAGRAQVLEAEFQDGHPCVPEGHEGEYKYGDKTYVVKGKTDTSFESCSAAVSVVLKKETECGAPQLQCTFNGAWGGLSVPGSFYVSSYFWDRATDAKIIADPAAISAPVTPAEFADAARRACQMPLKELATEFPRVDDSLAPYFCMDLSYMHTLLTGGFKVPEDKSITLVKKIKYHEEEVEAAWPLGAAINMLES